MLNAVKHLAFRRRLFAEFILSKAEGLSMICL